MSILNASVFIWVVIFVLLKCEFATAGTPVEWTDTTAKLRPDLSKVFASHFIQGIQADPKLMNGFRFRRLESAKKAGDILYDVVLKGNTAVGNWNILLPQLVSEAVTSNFQKATPEAALGTFAYSGGNFLFLLGVLTPENVLELSEGMFEAVKDNVYAVVGSSQEDYIRAICSGYTGFFILNGFLRLDTAAILAVSYAIEWLKL